jgi:pheromone shutdown-related protein TraB
VNDSNLHHVRFEEKEVTIVGTAHVSRQSAELVSQVIHEQKPETVCIELCSSRYQSLTDKDRWRNMDLLKVVREKKAFVLLSNLLLTSFQKRIGEKLGVKPGEEMMRAIDAAKAVGAQVHLADRDIRTTLARVWRAMGLWSKIKLILNVVLSAGQLGGIEQEDVERMKKEDIL